MSDQESLDVGKIVSLIMENPALIEQIMNLTKNQKTVPAPEPLIEPEEPKNEESETAAVSVSKSTYSEPLYRRSNRAQLLGALKPYVSKERAKALDSMISIADVLDMMKTR